MNRYRRPLLVLSLVALCVGRPAWAEDASTNAAAEARLLESARYLASDELEGRGVGSKGLDLAADYVAAQFKALGLKTDLWDGGPFQKFKMVVGAELGAKNEVALVGPAAEGSSEPRRMSLKLKTEFNPLALGGSGTFELPLVFAGYGITAKDQKYDDYEGLDVKDKAVIVLRRGPQQGNPHSLLGSTRSPHAPLTRKISNAFEHGAAAVIFVTDEFELTRVMNERRKLWLEAIDKLVATETEFRNAEKPTREQLEAQRKKIDELVEEIRSQSEKLAAEYDPVVEFNAGGTDTRSGKTIPVLHMRRGVIDPILKSALKTDLASLEKQIDEGPAPRSQALAGWKISGELTVNKKEVEVKNVGAVLEGEGELADETIVIGAHYDHVGRGGPGSGAIGNTTEIHNGADDNGSGTSAVIEVARQLVARAPEKKNRRRILFMAFTAEERGLIGSAQYTKAPLYKLDETAAMVNMDMVGRLTDDKLIIEGSGTATEFDGLIDRFNESHGFKITKKPTGYGPSDQASFYAKKIPVLFFFTGTHKDYHRPSDDYEKLNIAGMRRIASMAADMGLYLAESAARPTYQEVATPRGQGGGDRPWFGSIPDFAQDQPGYALTGVTKDGPAEKAGIKGGDVIVKLGESQIGNLEDFDSALRKYKPGDKVKVVIKREGKDVTLEVTLGKAQN